MVGWGRAYTYIYNDHEYKVEVQANVKSKGGWEVRLSGEHKTPIIETLECSVFQDQISLTRSDNSHQNKAFVNLKNPSSLQVSLNGETYRLDRRTPPEVEITSHTRVPLQFQKNLTAPMAGMVAKISVQEGDEVEAHQVLVILEAMKMELPVTSPQAGKVKRLNVKEKMVVEGGAILVELE
jgi:biotin carboxyl carrier protein